MPLSYDSRYRAKQVIDSFGYRFSKGGSASVIELVKLRVGTIVGAAYSVTAMVAALVWTPIAFSLNAGVSEVREDRNRLNFDANSVVVSLL